MSTKVWAKALYICRGRNSYLTKGNFKMKSAIAILATVFAVSAFAQAPAKKEEAKPAAPAVAASAPAKAEVKKEEKKPAKSDSAKKDAPKADAKPAVPAK